MSGRSLNGDTYKVEEIKQQMEKQPALSGWLFWHLLLFWFFFLNVSNVCFPFSVENKKGNIVLCVLSKYIQFSLAVHSFLLSLWK